jgi:hypothetical protein
LKGKFKVISLQNNIISSFQPDAFDNLLYFRELILSNNLRFI